MARPGFDDPQWYQRAVFYEVFLRGFSDSSGDGNGDLRGLTERLDHLDWLGVDCVWLLPFYASPLRDGGYDISDFFTIHPVYGVLADAVELVDEAHKRGIRVIADLVLNHTSDQHPWFQESRQDRTNPKADWYVWDDDDQRWSEARIIFHDTERSNWTWDPLREQYYWHRFFPHQPDLNYDNPEVRQAMLDVVRYWLDLGLDGFRLDAVPYLYEADGTNGENLPETHEFLQTPAERGRRQPPGPGAAGRGQPVAERRGPVLRPRRRVPHVLPLPAHAPHVPGRQAGRSRADRVDPGRDPGPSRGLPVGPVPAQPRRADAGDGDRRRARRDVRGVRRGPEDAAQLRASAGGWRRCSTTAAR